MLGVLIPSPVLFGYGLDGALKKPGSRGKFIMPAALLAFMPASEITIDREMFPGEFNWHHQ